MDPWTLKINNLYSYFTRSSIYVFDHISLSSYRMKHDSVEITNKMQPCNRIYYSTVHWRLSMFRAAYRSSSGALNIFAASGLHAHVVTGRSQVPHRLDYGWSPHAYVNQRLQIELELQMMSGVPLETCWAFNEQWNNKFCSKVASCWLFLLNHIVNYIFIYIYIYIYIYIHWFWKYTTAMSPDKNRDTVWSSLIVFK